MASRSTIIIVSFLAGATLFALLFAFVPGLSTSVQRVIGTGQQNKTANSAKQATSEPDGVLPMSEEQIKAALIELTQVGPATVAKRLVVPGSIIPNADLIVHVSVKLSGTVAELRKNIGDEVAK